MINKIPHSVKAQPAIWFLMIPEDISPQELSTLKKILSSEEQKRMEAMGSEVRQREYVVAHALARIKAAQVLGIKPSDLPLSFPDDEAPKIDLADCFLSISHTTNIIVVAFATFPVGVDVEIVKERLQMEGVAKRYCSEEEFRDLFQLAGEARLKRYAELATLKEAYLKAAGLKITEVIDQTSFKITNQSDGSVTVINARPFDKLRAGSFDSLALAQGKPVINLLPAWQFRLFYPTPQTVLALVLQTSEKINPKIEKVYFHNVFTR